MGILDIGRLALNLLDEAVANPANLFHRPFDNRWRPVKVSLYAAVGQIPDPASNPKRAADRLDGVSESDPLDPAEEEQ